MTERPDDGPLTWNVAGLLAEDPGAERVHGVDGVSIDLGQDLALAAPIAGHVRLSRTNRGILASADLHAALALQCSRCLRDITFGVDIRFREEFLPSVDPATGRPVATVDERDVGKLSDHHELDLEISVREALQLAEPLAPLCRPDCLGLCSVCGGRMDEGSHDHPDEETDPRLAALRGFRASDA